MSVRSLGLVAVVSGGTPVRLTKNEPDPTADLHVHSVLVQQVPGNTGKLYVGDRQAMVKATGVGVVAILPIPTVNVLASYQATIIDVPNGIAAQDLWLDAESNTEGAIVSVIER